MKHKKNLTQIARQLSIFGLIFFAAVISAQAQVRSFVDCVERVDADNYRAYFGYVSFFSSSILISPEGVSNYFYPIPDPPGQPFYFLPGVHHRAVAVVIPNAVNETWVLGPGRATSSFTSEMLCGADGANSRAFTYQGKLTDGGAAANGAYDLRFQLFNQATGGTARSATLDVGDVSVTNGIFTVSLDFGAISLPSSLGTDNTTTFNLGLNPAILDAEDTFVEIGVRAGNSTGAYTTLNPRQPITAVPLAMRANTANNAFRAANADKLGGIPSADFIQNVGYGTTPQTGQYSAPFSFNINGSGTLGGSLTVGGTIYGTVTNATNSAQLGGVAASQYVQTNDARLSNARTPTAGSANYIQNTTTQQTSANFNLSGNGTLGGMLSANTVNASSNNPVVLNGTSSSIVGTRLALQNTTTGGTIWDIISTGSGNGEGAGKLVFFNEGSNTAPLQINGGGANIIGNLSVSGSINGTVTNATNATNVSGGFVQLPLTTGAPPASECNAASQYGRQKVDAANVRLYICTAAGWKFTALQ